MKHSPSILILSLLLGACSHQGKLKTAYDAEQSAWQTAKIQIKEQCSHFKDSNDRVPQEKSVENNECEIKIIKETVLPVAAFPEEILNWGVNTAAVAKQYKDGKIDREEANILMDAAWAEYSNKANQKFRGAQQIAEQKDAKSFKEFIDSLQPQPSNVKTTRCNVFMDTLTCTEM